MFCSLIRLALLFFVFIFQGKINCTEPDSLIKVLEKSFSKVNDYTCMFYKKEFVNNKYIEKKNIYYKFMKPNFYYLKWTEGEDEGMEAIYAGKKYNNKLKLHICGILGLLNIEIDPKGKKALKRNRHSVLESDIGYMIGFLKKELNIIDKTLKPIVQMDKECEIDGNEAILYISTFPKTEKFYSHKIYVYVNKRTNLPIRFVVHDRNDKVIEAYQFNDLKINVGLKDIDFDVDNPDYDY